MTYADPASPPISVVFDPSDSAYPADPVLKDKYQLLKHGEHAPHCALYRARYALGGALPSLQA